MVNSSDQFEKAPAVCNSHVGSGSDLNSDSERLQNRENLQDKVEEDTFPASDPPSSTPLTGIGGSSKKADTDLEKSLEVSGLPPDFKDNKEAQFNYGRRAEQATHHFDRESKRLYRGNPDVGDVDLGTIEADRPAQKDDNDPEREY